MIKISALNEEFSEESEEENTPTITKEAQEQIAVTEYNKALKLVKEENLDEAMNMFKDLLETELLDQVEKHDSSDGRSRPMLSLKYCCYKNIGLIYSKMEDYEKAIEYYWEAANLDDTDVMLWCRMGRLAVLTSNLEFACSAFKQGLKCNPNHWPCLDSIITVMYAVPDYMNCLLYISMALERDSSYVKGLAFREKIFNDVPHFKESYKLFNPDWSFDPPLNTEFDRVAGEKFLSDAKKVADKWIEASKSEFEYKSIPDLHLCKPIAKYSWIDLGMYLIGLHEYISDNSLNFLSKIKVEIECGDGEPIDQHIPEEIETVVDIPADLEPENLKSELFIPSSWNSNDEDLQELKNEHVGVDDDERSNRSSDIRLVNAENRVELDKAKKIQLENDTKKKKRKSSDFPNDLYALPATICEFSEKQQILEVNCGKKFIGKFDEKLSARQLNDEPGMKDDQQKVKKRRRSSLCFLQQWAWSSTSQRRSPRVRGSNRKETEREDVQLEETMRRIFPTNLLPDTAKIIRDDPLKSIDDSMDTMDLYKFFTKGDNNSKNDNMKCYDSSKSPSPEPGVEYFGSARERNDVLEFIHQHSGKSNLMITIARFSEFLAGKWNSKWPRELVDVYLQTYQFTRQHIPHSPLFYEFDEEESVLNHYAEMTLLFCELHTDKWLQNKPAILTACTIDTFGTGIPSEELGYIIFASVRNNPLDEDDVLFLLRVLWVKANLFMCQGDAEEAIKSLELLLHSLEEFELMESSVALPNCRYFSRINLQIVQKRLASIERVQKLGEVQQLYDEKKYFELSLILQDTFKFTKKRNEILSVMKLNVDRIKQLSMLLDCVWNLGRYEDCFVWAETCLDEAWQAFINCTDESNQKKWSQSILNSLEKLESSVELAGPPVVKLLSDSRASRLVQNLIQIVCHQLDTSEANVEMPLETVIPWILFHYILQYEDDKERVKSRITSACKALDSQESEADDGDNDIPAPLMILFTGHSFLGRHSWCCINEAKLLIFTMKAVIPRMCGLRLLTLREKIGKHLEQIFWCLYGHPSRMNKTKPKHLEDHGVPQISLTWEMAQLIFEFYKPYVFPEFDTAKTTAITADTKLLFKKISSLVPKELDPCAMIDDMTSHIVGDAKQPPVVTKPLPYQVDSLYYLLGDYSFKNNIWPSAIKYYTMDIIFHPDAFNSWVALAMSVSTVIGTSLNNCRPLADFTKLLYQAKIAEHSYRKAVELKPGHSVIWIEYGSFVYAVHSFCSRLLKQESDTLSMEKFAVLETRKEHTLDEAANCFRSANSIYMANIDDEPHMQDERWLYHYMLAKISEKKNDDPPIFLEHYANASALLQQNNAHYPRRISHKSANYLSIEALEVHYRIHASILKYLEQHEGKPLKKTLGMLFLRNLVECSNGPFMQFQSKLTRNKRKEDLNRQQTMEPQPSENFVDKFVPTLGSCETKTKWEGKKRFRETVPEESSKKMKVGNISHLELMHDVVSLIDDLITNVCNVVSLAERKKFSIVDPMPTSSDESDKERPIELSKICETQEQNIAIENPQDIMNDLMKETMEIGKAQLLLPSKQDHRKETKLPLDKMAHERVSSKEKELKEKYDRKRGQISTMKNDTITSRRGSQESNTTTFTTTTNETNNSSFSSSDESSSSDDSSDSDTSSVESEEESAESDIGRKKTLDSEEKEEYCTDAEVSKVLAYCLAGLEQCILRFPEHYKSIYRLSHFYFNSKCAKDNVKCRNLLLGVYECQYYAGLSFQGLFAERKSTNFFNGVWRIPNEEIDRPGSFASHMSRCVTLLLQVLKETADSQMLMELCIQLRKTPEVDKKYVRDSEREQLSRQALTLCLQSLRTRLSTIGSLNTTENAQIFLTDTRTHILSDVYKIYQQVQKNFHGKEVQAFATLLVDTYKSCMGIQTAGGNLLEAAIKCCHQQNQANKMATSHSLNYSHSLPSSIASSSSTVIQTQVQPLQITPQIRKPNKHTGTGRPRGRPPNVNKYIQAMQSDNGMNRFNKNGAFGSYMGATGNQSLMNPFFVNPLMEQNFISAMLATGLGGNMLDPLSAVNYLTHMGSYQDLLRQYQNNLSPLSTLTTFGSPSINFPNVSNIPTTSTKTIDTCTTQTSQNESTNAGSMKSLGNLTVHELINSNNSVSSTTINAKPYGQTKSGTTVSTGQDIPHSVSITPVEASVVRQKSSRIIAHTLPITTNIVRGMQPSQPTKSLHYSPTQHSLLKTSVTHSSKATVPKRILASHSGVSTCLSEPQPAHNASLPVSPLKTGGLSSITLPPAGHVNFQNSDSNVNRLPLNMQPQGTTLQHKLLSKIQRQQIPRRKISLNSIKKPKLTTRNRIPPISMNFQSLLSVNGSRAVSAAPFIPSEGTGISVINQPIHEKKLTKIPNAKHTNKQEHMDICENIPNLLPQSSSTETLSMLSQLQQHSHLEIIPQLKNYKTSVEYTTSMSLPLTVVPSERMDSIRPIVSESMAVYDVPRKFNNLSQKSDEQVNDSVEIITLDD